MSKKVNVLFLAVLALFEALHIELPKREEEDVVIGTGHYIIPISHGLHGDFLRADTGDTAVVMMTSAGTFIRPMGYSV